MKRTAFAARTRASLRTGASVGLLPLLLWGCHLLPDAITNANNSAKLPGTGLDTVYRVRASDTAFYHISPLQVSGPDEQLKRDTEVTLVNSSRAYSRVKTASGETGYVATEDIAPLTSQELAAANTSSIQAQLETQRQTAARSMGGSGYTIPPEAGNSEALPVADPRPAGGGSKADAAAAAKPTPNPIFHQ